MKKMRRQAGRMEERQEEELTEVAATVNILSFQNITSNHSSEYLLTICWGLPGGSMVRTWHFNCWGPGSIPWSGN